MTELRDVRLGSSLCAHDLRKATEAAARAASGLDKAGFAAAIHAMDAAIDALDVDCRLFLGEGPRDAFPVLHHGRVWGNPSASPVWDLIADPIEGTAFTAPGMTNALACLAAVPAGRLYDPGPVFYMEKLALPPAAKGRIDPTLPVDEQLIRLAGLLGKPIAELTVYVQEKPRHRDLIARIAAAGARTALYPAGDVAGAILAAVPESGIDAMMGIGGSREGLIAACAVKLLGGDFLARPAPQLATERIAVAEAGIDTDTWLELDRLIHGDAVLFAASGITDGLLLDGATAQSDEVRVQSIVIGAPGYKRQIVSSWLRKA